MVRLGLSHLIDRSSSGDAFAWADSRVLCPDVERVELLRAQGRVLACAIHADADVPVRRTAAVDGFALRAANTHGAGDYSTLSLVLRPLAMLALLGCVDVPVWRQPVVRILMAGRFARDADSPMLAGLVRRDGGCAETVATAGDAASLGVALTRPGVDLIIVAGASGEGASDHAVPALQQAGAVHVRRVAINPGGEVALGEAAGVPVVLLPGNPLACFAAYDLVVGRLLWRLARLPGPWPYPARTMLLRSKLASTIGRLETCRVKVRDGQVEPLATRDGRRLASVVQADGFVIVPECSEGYGPGAEVLVHLYE